MRDFRGWISVFFLLIALLFISGSLWRGWIQIAPFFQKMNFYYLIPAEMCIALALFFGVANWYFVQGAYGIGLSGVESARSHLASNIIRYIPGYAWQYLSKAYLSGATRDNRQPISIALLTEFGILILSGISLSSFVAKLSPTFFVVNWLSPAIWGLIGLLSLLGIFAWFFLSFQFVQKSKPYSWHSALSILGALISSLVGWISLGLATWYVVFSFYPELALDNFPQVFFALVASTIIGILVVFVPGGIGVRETMLAFFLDGILPLSMGIVVSIILRLGIILGELIGFAFIFKGLYPFLMKRNHK